MKNSANTQVTNSETQENNKHIAEFMGLREESGDLILTLGNDEWYIDLSDEDTFKFEYDWNWLMPVVEKIKIVVMKDETDELYNSEQWDNITQCLVEVNMQSVYSAVVNFINWYNANK